MKQVRCIKNLIILKSCSQNIQNLSKIHQINFGNKHFMSTKYLRNVKNKIEFSYHYDVNLQAY